MSHWERAAKSNEWYTPKYIFDALDCVFDLDVAHPPNKETHVPAKQYLSGYGIEHKWFGFVWMNPPYGGRNGLVPWLEKFFSHGNGIALVPDRTSTPWCQDAIRRSDLLLFVAPKIKFENETGEAGTSPSNGTILIASGANGISALSRANGKIGLCCQYLCTEAGE